MRKHLEYKGIDHKYILNGAEVPSVTQVIRIASQYVYGTYAPTKSREAMDKGTMIHLALADMDDPNTPKMSGTQSNDFVRYRMAWKAFLTSFNAKPFLVEARVASVRYGYAGTLDRVMQMTVSGKRGYYVVDIKTGSSVSSPLARLQTAGYVLATKEWLGESLPGPIEKTRVVVHIPHNGQCYHRVEIFKDSSDEPAFLSCLALYKWIANNIK
jgi:hypothetical protein